ncbi:MAG: NADH-quinone oxidoreductase subunit M [Anaerolineae bacterium]|jgi:NADH-quinone oxidoreductase subunit M
MILTGLILWLVAAALLAWFAGRWGKDWPRWVSLIALLLHLAALVALWVQYLAQDAQFATGALAAGAWLMQVDVAWIPQLGIHFHLALDGLSLLLLLLTDLLGIMAVAASWRGIEQRVGFFHLNLLWILAALVGVFLALDLFLFYFFWEMMLVPLYFLIGIWGHERRIYATLKFFLFTQASGLLMLLGILGIYFVHGQNTGVYTFNYLELLGTSLPATLGLFLMLGFSAAFAVKLPAVPFHTWLPDAHTEAPTAGSVILAGLVLKAGAYGFLRLLMPLFPEAASRFAPIAMILGVLGILYGALLAFAQTDLKRLVAYTSVSHMGFVLLGIFAWNRLALQGAIVVMLSHGISTGALFFLVGGLYDRIKTRDVERMGGLWSAAPRMGGAALVFALASLGLPGLGNFVGEFLVLLGVYQVNVPLAILATLGLIAATVYALSMMQRVFFGKAEDRQLSDLDLREGAIMAVLIVLIVWLGLFPKTVLNTAQPALEALQQAATHPHPAGLPPPDAPEIGQTHRVEGGSP